jgi:hypothetical protein
VSGAHGTTLVSGRPLVAGAAARAPPPIARQHGREMTISLQIGTKVRVVEPFRPENVPAGTVGTIVLIEPLPAAIGPPQRVRVKFGDYISPWLMPAQLIAMD